MSTTAAFDSISDIVLAAWEKAHPESYADCEGRVRAILADYGEQGAMVMIRALDSMPEETESPSQGGSD